MKKRFTIFALSLCVGIGLYASAEFKTHCGYVGTTVAPEYFKSVDEYAKYIQELNEIYCGEEGNVSVPKIERFQELKSN